MSDFKIEKVLGKGSFGSVYLVTRKKDKKIYALKTVILEKLNKKEQENSVNEVRILASINHPNVIGYKEAFWNDKESSLNIVMEYADDGDLQTKIQRMRKEGGMFNEDLIWSYSIQMIEGLKALHDKKIMHRDLKSANIFLVKEKHQCKLGDMNVSKVIKDKCLLTQTGTPYYASPEVWNDVPYSYKSDLWSIGCVIYELCALHPPFNGKDLDELYVNVCNGKVERINKIYSDDLWKMILMLLQVDTKKRVDCDTFLNNKFIVRKKNEIKELNFLESKFNEKNINNGVLLNTIKFNNINEIKAQLPTNKNYNDEINSEFNNINQLSTRNNTNKSNTTIVKNPSNNFNNNNFIKNISNILSKINNTNSNQHNSKINNTENGGKNALNIDHLINQTSSERDKFLEKKIKNHNSSKDKKSSRKNYNDIINYDIENEEEKNLKRKRSEKERSKDIEYARLLEQMEIQKEIQKIKGIEDKILKKAQLREILYTPNINTELSSKKSNYNFNKKERIKTEEVKTNYIKINQNSHRYNPLDLIPSSSIKKAKSNRLELKQMNNNKSIDNMKNNKYTKGKNSPYYKINELKSLKKSKYGIPIYSYGKKERNKTPISSDKNNNRLKSDIYDNDNDNYNYYYYKNCQRLKTKEYSDHQKSVGYLRINPNENISELNELSNILDLKNSKSSKNNVALNSKIIKKDINSKNKGAFITKIRPISSSSRRKKFLNNMNMGNNNDIKNFMTTEGSKKDYEYDISYFYSNKIKSKIKTINNNNISSFSIGLNEIIPYNKNKTKSIRHKYTYNANNTNNSYNYLNEKYSSNIVDKNNEAINKINNKKIPIENTKNKKCDYSYEKNVKKLNNKVRHYTFKRSYDEKVIRSRKKKDLMSKRDLTEPELMMISNPIKIKDSYRNNSNNKNMNITLNDNINQNAYLKQIRQSKGLNDFYPQTNQYYSNNTNNIGLEKNNCPQIFNNFYSINNVGNANIPVKVINVYN